MKQTGMKEYIGSQQHFEDEINARHEQEEEMKREHDKQMAKQYEQEYYREQLESMRPTQEVISSEPTQEELWNAVAVIFNNHRYAGFKATNEELSKHFEIKRKG